MSSKTTSISPPLSASAQIKHLAQAAQIKRDATVITATTMAPRQQIIAQPKRHRRSVSIIITHKANATEMKLPHGSVCSGSDASKVEQLRRTKGTDKAADAGTRREGQDVQRACNNYTD